ncbi:MAG: penicillin-binding protein 1B [Gammaproteobacteria bacterium]
MSSASKKKTSKKKGKKRTKSVEKVAPVRFKWLRLLWRYGRWPLLLGIAALAFYVALLDRQIINQFEGRRWDVPARVFAQPLELYASRTLERDALIEHLGALGYRRVDSIEQPGQYRVGRNEIELQTRPFAFWDSAQVSQQATIEFGNGVVRNLSDARGDTLPLLRLDPVMIGSIVPGTHEDRIVLAPTDVPQLLRDTLVAVEDRRFYSHHGVNFKAIARAFWVNLRAGEVRQGGSTLTQQLVKNYFLTNEQRYRRKLTEALMAVLLEARYTKRELLNGYVNEIFLGQDGARAVHGFGLGSRFYFGVPLAELDTAQIALLVAIIRGPTYYDPRRHPERALKRRDRVLNALVDEGVLDRAQADAAIAEPLGVVARPGRVMGASPAFMDAVREQLARDYAAEDLNSAGLRIFTTLDTFVQARAETISARELTHVERDTGLEEGTLQVGAVITDPQTGELIAAVGGREPGFAGFNRALSLSRPIGSLVKPFVYLSALETGRYHLGSIIPNTPLEVTLDNGDVWAPQNYSATELGDLPIYRALAESINLPAVHVGLDIGIDRVAQQIEAALPTLAVPRYPSLTLGALNLSPGQVAEAYATLATGGYVTPMRAVREVVNARGEPLSRYELRVRRSADEQAVAQILAAMEVVMAQGTGRSARGVIPASLNVAGKSGSSNDYRDGWFAGFSADRLAVVWVGRDDNQPMGLSGARSALPIWSQLMHATAQSSLQTVYTEQLVQVPFDYTSGMLADEGCPNRVLLPFPTSAEPPALAPCAEGPTDTDNDGLLPWLRDRLGLD